ncbi:uncharacterized protein LOC127656345 [Xyrauchen texanus]|uniref:uncharacterized protein LOC127656345 n=1 Tax=Xyrauchen texanus TaxID=154827 RepID=UPI002241E977|nr:uncharacterized protein LOC127656345 [Xyrauchen texanus]
MFPPGDVDKCRELSEKLTGVKMMEIPWEVCNASFVKSGYTWASFSDVLHQYEFARNLANRTVFNMDHLHDYLEDKCYNPTSMAYNVTAWMHLQVFKLNIEMMYTRAKTSLVPLKYEELLWDNYKSFQVRMWPQLSAVAIGDEWFDRAKQFRQFLSPIPSVQEIRDLESKTPSEDCAKHRLTHPMGPAWCPVDKSKKANEAELSLCVAELKQETEYFPRLKGQTARQKFITAFLEQIKTNDPFAGYEYLNSVWLKSKGTPWYTDSEPPSAIAVALVLAFSVGAIFTDMTETVEEYVEEAWEEFVAASEDLVMGAVKYVLYAFGALLGMGVLCLCVWMCVRFCFSYVCRSACSNLNPSEEENRLRKLTTRLEEKLKKDNIQALL